MSNKRIYLAPMVGRTDEHYRAFIRLLSRNIYLYTEMITCDAYLNTDRKLYKVKPEEGYLTIQLAGSDPEKFSKCAEIIEKQGYSEINLNIGCPSNKVIRGQFGACLMSDPDKVAKFVKNIKQSCSLPVSIKTRLGLGYDTDLDLLRNLIDKTSEVGCNKYFIHARNAILTGISPKKNRKVPLLRYSDAIKIKNLYPSLSIILNGGIDKIDIIKENINNFDGVMIGRRIYNHPLFLLEIESQIFGNNKNISTQKIIKEYAKYAMLRSNEGIKSYLLLRHLFNLYYNTNLSKKWKKFIHETIYNHEDVSNIIYFEEMYYEKKISTYG